MDTSQLKELPVDVFIKQLTYLPFDQVITICSSDRQFHKYCSDPYYQAQWKSVIDTTFGQVYNYPEKLEKIQREVHEQGVDSNYNYLVYTQFIKLLDPITQLMIYYRQGDNKNFDKGTKVQQFLALFLLRKRNVIEEYLPNENYRPFIDMLDGDKIPQEILNKMVTEFAREGNMRGVLEMIAAGGNSRYFADLPLRSALSRGHIEVIEYLLRNVQNPHIGDLFWNAAEGGLEAVKYLRTRYLGFNDYELLVINTAYYGHLDLIRYIVEDLGTNIARTQDEALVEAAKRGHLPVVEYLVDKGVNVHGIPLEDEDAEDYIADAPLMEAAANGHLDVVKFLVSRGADIRANNDLAIKEAHLNKHMDVVQYLAKEGNVNIII